MSDDAFLGLDIDQALDELPNGSRGALAQEHTFLDDLYAKKHARKESFQPQPKLKLKPWAAASRRMRRDSLARADLVAWSDVHCGHELWWRTMAQAQGVLEIRILDYDEEDPARDEQRLRILWSLVLKLAGSMDRRIPLSVAAAIWAFGLNHEAKRVVEYYEARNP